MGWRDGWTFYPVKKSEKVIHVEPQINDPDGQNIKELWADFLGAIRSKRRAVRDIEIGYRATAAPCLAWSVGASDAAFSGTVRIAQAMRPHNSFSGARTAGPGSTLPSPVLWGRMVSCSADGIGAPATDCSVARGRLTTGRRLPACPTL